MDDVLARIRIEADDRASAIIERIGMSAEDAGIRFELLNEAIAKNDGALVALVREEEMARA